MKAYIQCNKDLMPYNKNTYTAMDGFCQMGIETVLFHQKAQLKESRSEDVIVGGVGTVKSHLAGLGIAVLDIDYPEELKKYLGRRVWKSNISDLLLNKLEFPVFVKPLEGKLFTGSVISSERDLIGKVTAGSSFFVYYSEVIPLEAEFRCYVRYQKILDIKRYKGKLNVFYDYAVISSAISDYKSGPAAYAIDFGVTKDNRTVLIEVNDGYSLGNYGLDSLLYARLLSARWAEITGTRDLCAFDFPAYDIR